MAQNNKRTARSGWLGGAFALTALGLACFICFPAQAALNDTGITEVANSEGHGLNRDTRGYPAQDARYGRDAAARAGKLKKTGGGSKGFDFTKLDATGKPLPAAAKKWDCVRDNVTGLTWEVKTADGGLHDLWNQYSWYNPDPASNGGNAGARNAGKCTGSECDTDAYVRAVNTEKLCGYSDWRLPERQELRSLVDFGKALDVGRDGRARFMANDNNLSTIDSAYFPHTPTRCFWSATSLAESPEQAWRLFFFDGGDRFGVKDLSDGTAVHARLVRSGP